MDGEFNVPYPILIKYLHISDKSTCFSLFFWLFQKLHFAATVIHNVRTFGYILGQQNNKPLKK